MFLGTFKKKFRINGYIKNNLVEPLSLLDRFDDLKQEINRRGLKFAPILDFDLCLLDYLPNYQIFTAVNQINALDDLIRRCPVCASRYQVLVETDWIPKRDEDVLIMTNGERYSRKKHLKKV